MIDLQAIAPNEISQSMRLLREEIIARGWRAKIPYTGSPHCFIDRGDGQDLHIFSTTPLTISYADAHLADDKYAMHVLLESADIEQLRTVLVMNDNNSKEAETLVEMCGKVVVKPLDGGHGKGITVNIANPTDLKVAIEYARLFTKNSNNVLVQEQYTHDNVLDLRLTCINGKFIAATYRMPARVRGDGVSTITQLITAENASDRRGEAYYAALANINMIAATTYLGDKTELVPADGEEVHVLGIANYGAGGETYDVTDDIPEFMVAAAEKVANVTNLAVCGVDFIVSALPQKDSSESDINPVVIEVNKSPSLGIHDLPTHGRSRGAVAAYADYLASL
jgi:cyanophycin synthetase